MNVWEVIQKIDELEQQKDEVQYCIGLVDDSWPVSSKIIASLNRIILHIEEEQKVLLDMEVE